MHQVHRAIREGNPGGKLGELVYLLLGQTTKLNPAEQLLPHKAAQRSGQRVLSRDLYVPISTY